MEDCSTTCTNVEKGNIDYKKDLLSFSYACIISIIIVQWNRSIRFPINTQIHILASWTELDLSVLWDEIERTASWNIGNLKLSFLSLKNNTQNWA